MNSVFAGLRFPVSFAFGLMLAATLFSTLWWFTDKTFDVKIATPVEFGFTRLERDETIETRREPKPELEAPPPVVEVPRIGGPMTDTVGPIVIASYEPIAV